MRKLIKLSTLVAISILVGVCVWLLKGRPALDNEIKREELNSNENVVANVKSTSSEINFDVFALAPTDKTAVLKYPDDSLILVRVGDSIDSGKFLVGQITHDKVVVKDTESEDQYFIYIESDEGKRRVQKVSNRIDAPDSLPVSVRGLSHPGQ